MGLILYTNKFYQLGISNLYGSVNAMKIGKPIASHTNSIIQIALCKTGLSLGNSSCINQNVYIIKQNLNKSNIFAFQNLNCDVTFDFLNH